MSALQPIESLAWFDISDPGSPQLDELALRYHLHELDIEDCRHRPQRAKAEERPHYIFAVLKHLCKMPIVSFDDFDVLVGQDFFITVHAEETELVERIRKRAVAEKLTRLDRLFYVVMDEVVDQYLPMLDSIAEETTEIENAVLLRPEPHMLRHILRLKRKLVVFRRIATSMREVVNGVMRREGGMIGDDLDPYFRDVYDHLIRTVDLIESHRDLLTGALDIYLSAVANRTNEVMKTLTIWGTVALPLVVITGFFGMNLDLPFQHKLHGLMYAVGLMMLSVGLTLYYFRRKGWF